MLLLILTTGKVLFYSFVTVIALYIIAKVVDKIKTVRYEKDIAFLESCVKNFVITPRNQKMIEQSGCREDKGDMGCLCSEILQVCLFKESC